MSTRRLVRVRIPRRAFRCVAIVIGGLLGFSSLTISAEVSNHQTRNQAGRSHTAGSANPSVASRTGSSKARQRAFETYGKLPLSFEANQGQTDSQVKFLSRGSGYTLFLTGDEAVLSVGKSNVESQKSKVKDAIPGDRTSNPESLTPSVVRLKLVGANRAAEVTGLEELPGKSNYFIGNDPKKWRTKVPNYAKVKYEGVYPGIDLVYYGNQRQLEYDWVIAPGANPSAIMFAIDGSKKVEVDRGGDLVLKTSGGEVRFRKPVVYQVQSAVDSQQSIVKDTPNSNRQSTIGNRQFLDGRYVLRQSKFANPKSKIQNPNYEVAFEIAAYDPRKPLVIDPLLTFSTFLGGSDEDFLFPMAVDSTGIYVAGNTVSTDFPTATQVTAPLDTTCGSDGACNPNFSGVLKRDAFVSKLDLTGSSLIWSTYLGGSGSDTARGLTVDGSGDVFVTGHGSASFPTTGGAFSTSGVGSLFVTELDPSGASLIYSALFGGTGFEQGRAIALDDSGNAYVAGYTESTDFPTTTGAFQETSPGGTCGTLSPFPCDHGFVLSLSNDGSTLLNSTYLAGSAEDIVLAMAFDSGNGNFYVSGATSSSDFTTPGVTQSGFKGSSPGCDDSNAPLFSCGDGFVIELDPTLSTPVFLTFLGGSDDDGATSSSIALDGSGNAYVAGFTSSPDFPVTSGAFQTVAKGGTCGTIPNTFSCADIFVTKLDSTGSPVYSTYLGGSGNDFGNAIAVDSGGSAYVFGSGSSSDYPLASPLYSTCNGCSIAGLVDDLYLTKLNPSGSAIIFSTFFGGSNGLEQGNSIYVDSSLAVDSSLPVYIAGFTSSTDFPTTSGAFRTTFGGPTLTPTCPSPGIQACADGFIAKLTDLFLPVATVTPSSLDFGFVGVGSSSLPMTVTLKNDGDNVLGVTSPIAIVGDADNPDASDFVITGGSCSTASFVLNPGASCTIDVTFTPTQSNARRALLEIVDNAYGSPHRVSLAGNGPVLILSPSSMFFDGQQLDVPSSTQIATLFNNGSATVTINSISTSGDFSQSNSCDGKLDAGTSCNIDISFTPTAPGISAGILTVTDNASATPETANLQGQGVAMLLSTQNVSFSARAVGTTSPAQTVILVNAGSSPVTISSIVPSGDFAQSNNCGASRPAKSGCTISVTFTPTATGFRSGSITITHSSPESPQVISLFGQGGVVAGPVISLVFSPSFVSFGSQTLNTTSAATPVTMTNNTTGALSITSITASGDFARTTNCGATLAAGASCTINVTFKPTAVGGRSGSITVTHSGADSPSTLGLSGQGVVMVVSPTFLSFQSGVGVTSPSQSVTLTNTGATTVSSIVIAASGVFAQSNTCGTSLAAHASCNIDVTFTPSALVFVFGQVTINSTAPDSPAVSLFGNGTTVLLSPSSLDFGPQALFITSSARSIAMVNQTGGTLAITSIVPSGDFAETDNCGTSLAVDASCLINVTFTPTAVGVRTGMITVTDGSVDSPHKAPLQGTGAVMILDPPTLSFAPQGLGTTSTTQVATLTNTSDVTVNFTSPIAVTSGTFSQTNDCGTSLVSGGFCSISVKFTPDEAGQEYGTVTIIDDAEDSPQALRLTGIGTTLVFSPGSLGFASQNVGTTSLAQSITVTNATASPISMYGVSRLDSGAGLDFAVTNNCPSSLASGANCTVDVTFSPTVGGFRFESLSFVDNAPDSPQLTFAFGTGVAPANPVPVIAAPLVPASAVAGGAGFTLTVNGSNFVPGATVNWDGFSLTTTFASSTKLTASVPATNIATSGTASVTVVNPTPGGGISNIVSFLITSTAPTLSLSATALTMPTTPLNLTCAPRVVTVTNTGSSTVSFSGITTSSAEFTETDTCGTSLAAGANCMVSVVFHPTTTGVRTGTLTITSNATGSPHVVSLTGTGEPPCPLTALVKAQRVLRGSDTTTFTVFPETGCEAKDQIALSCQNAAPAMCDFNPGTIQNPERSQMALKNLRAVGDSIKQFQVLGRSADLERTLYLQVLFADFSFTKYPNEASVKAGETASYAISIVPVNGLAGRMVLKCTGVPVGTSCTVTPGEVTLAGGPVQVAVKVGTTQRGGIVRPPTEMAPRFPAPDSRLPIMLWSVLALLAAATGLAITKRKTKLALGLAMLCVLTWGSCGGGGGVGPTGWQGGTPLGTHTLVIQGTLATPGAGMGTDANTPPLTHETQITLKVE